MDETDTDIKEFTKKYWSSIRTFSKKNKVQNNFNFYYKKEQKNCFKVNYSLAYILKNIETDKLRYFYVSYNNHLMLEQLCL